MEKRLKFRDGKFKIMQITDIQDTADVDADTLRLITAALNREKPDLVVLTGDQLRGHAQSMKKEENVKKTIRQITGLFEEQNIHFTLAFGNHDAQSLPAPRQLEWYRESAVCLAEDTPGVSGCGNHNLVIENSHGKPALNVYMLDSHGAAGIGYEPLADDQIEWYKNTREALRERAGDYVPSLLFQHIPVEAMYRLLKGSGKKSKGAVRGFAGFKNKYFSLDESKVYPGGRLLEALCVPESDAGLFEAVCEKGEMLGMFFGHDHKNSFAGRLDGVDLGYCPGCGFAAYGDGVNRGVRVFEIDEADPRAYKTRVLTYGELFGARHVKRLSHWITDQSPTSIADGITKGIKLLACAAALAGIIIGLTILL